MQFINFTILALLFGIALMCTACEKNKVEYVTLQEKLETRQNPTNYEFEASVVRVRNAIKKAYGIDWYLAEAKKNQARYWEGVGDAAAKHALTLALQQPPPSLFFKGDADSLSKNLLTKAGNDDDAYLFGSTSPVGESPVYFKDGKPLIYYADFHIHLTAVNPEKTRVDIVAYDSCVVTGLDESWSPHGPSFVFVNVAPTTIEQYQILLGIGNQLGVTNMPSLVTPGPNTPIKELSLPRAR